MRSLFLFFRCRPKFLLTAPPSLPLLPCLSGSPGLTFFMLWELGACCAPVSHHSPGPPGLSHPVPDPGGHLHRWALPWMAYCSWRLAVLVTPPCLRPLCQGQSPVPGSCSMDTCRTWPFLGFPLCLPLGAALPLKSHRLHRVLKSEVDLYLY